MIQQVRLYIKGDVIGVGFRAWVKIQAKVLGVSGWVRNTFDKPDVFGTNGGVEVLLQTGSDVMTTIIEILKKVSPVSYVESVELYKETPTDIIDGFEIRR